MSVCLPVGELPPKCAVALNQIETIRPASFPVSSTGGFCDAPHDQRELVAPLGRMVGRMGTGVVAAVDPSLRRTRLCASRSLVDYPANRFWNAGFGALRSVDHPSAVACRNARFQSSAQGSTWFAQHINRDPRSPKGSRSIGDILSQHR